MSNSEMAEYLNRQLYPHYSILSTIAESKTAVVYKALQSSTQELVAIKVIDTRFMEMTPKERIHRVKLIDSEAQAMRICSSQHLIKLIEKLRVGFYVLLVMEFCDGPTLTDYVLQRRRPLSEGEALIIMQQLACGLQELQNKNIIHRDLKPNNIFMKANSFKIGDLGFVRHLSNQDELTTTIMGTPNFMAPEIINQQSYGFLVDMWSLGALFYFLLTRNYLFTCSPGETLHKMMTKLKASIPPRLPETVSKEAQQLVTRMLTIDPKMRINWSQFYSHPLMRNQPVVPSSVLTRSLPSSEVRSEVDSFDHEDRLTGDSDMTEHSQHIPAPSEIDDKKMESTSYTRNRSHIVQSVEQSHSRILAMQSDFEQYSKKIRLEITKLNILLKYVIQIENANLKEMFRKSRRITELRLMVAERCMKKAEMLSRYFYPETYPVKHPSQKHIFEFENDKAFRKSQEWQSLLSIYKVSYKECKQEFEVISSHLSLKEKQINNRFKDFFRRLVDEENYKKKEAIICGIQTHDYTIEEHTNFVRSYLKQIEPRFNQQYFEPCRSLYCMFASMKYYQDLALYHGNDKLPESLSDDLENSIYLPDSLKAWQSQIGRLRLFR